MLAELANLIRDALGSNPEGVIKLIVITLGTCWAITTIINNLTDDW